MVECVNVSYDNSPITALNRASDTYDKNFDVILPYVNTVFTFSLVFFKVTYYDAIVPAWSESCRVTIGSEKLISSYV